MRRMAFCHTRSRSSYLASRKGNETIVTEFGSISRRQGNSWFLSAKSTNYRWVIIVFHISGHPYAMLGVFGKPSSWFRVFAEDTGEVTEEETGQKSVSSGPFVSFGRVYVLKWFLTNVMSRSCIAFTSLIIRTRRFIFFFLKANNIHFKLLTKPLASKISNFYVWWALRFSAFWKILII